eukprot:m.107715 g.107715  ORF g.107715 m.107715 type:complete len:166 (-) comp12698_c0_seq5:340-837(-)
MFSFLFVFALFCFVRFKTRIIFIYFLCRKSVSTSGFSRFLERAKAVHAQLGEQLAQIEEMKGTSVAQTITPTLDAITATLSSCVSSLNHELDNRHHTMNEHGGMSTINEEGEDLKFINKDLNDSDGEFPTGFGDVVVSGHDDTDTDGGVGNEEGEFGFSMNESET